MKSVPDKEATVAELVVRFTTNALAQHDASWKFQTDQYNRLFKRMLDIRDELKNRRGDQRRALIPLLGSDDVHVRLRAAIALLAIVPEQARSALESVRDYNQFPQSADASMMLRSLDDGSYIPD